MHVSLCTASILGGAVSTIGTRIGGQWQSPIIPLKELVIHRPKDILLGPPWRVSFIDLHCASCTMQVDKNSRARGWDAGEAICCVFRARREEG